MPRPRINPPAPTDRPAAKKVVYSDEARELYDSISERWDLHPAALALLDLVATALTKAGESEALCEQHGALLNDGKGGWKHNPASLLARDYRLQATNGLQKLMAILGSLLVVVIHAT
jgi:hypothetical protein